MTFNEYQFKVIKNLCRGWCIAPEKDDYGASIMTRKRVYVWILTCYRRSIQALILICIVLIIRYLIDPDGLDVVSFLVLHLKKPSLDPI